MSATSNEVFGAFTSSFAALMKLGAMSTPCA
jgi:hypothetical protein